MQRGDPFAYTCHRCKKCCHNKIIPLNPFEVVRLSRNRGVTTTAFIAAHTLDGEGTVLRFQNPDGSGPCGFLGEEGCTVHADRPLACRLYPLARWTMGPGIEAFAKSEGEPGSLGVYGGEGTVGSFLEGQSAEEFFDAADRYLTLFTRLSAVAERVESGEIVADGLPDGNWMDVDAVIENHCRERGENPPLEPQESMRLHIEIVNNWLDSME